MRITILIAFFVMLISITVSAELTESKYAEITSTIVPVHSELDPSSPVIKQLHKNDVYEIIGEGKLWIKVETSDNEFGWIPVSDCRVIDSQNSSILAKPVKTILFTIIMILAIGLITIFFIRQNSSDETAI